MRGEGIKGCEHILYCIRAVLYHNAYILRILVPGRKTERKKGREGGGGGGRIDATLPVRFNLNFAVGRVSLEIF